MNEEPLSKLCQQLYDYMSSLDYEGLHFERREALEALKPVQALEHSLLAVTKAAEELMKLWQQDPQATLLGIPALGEALAATPDHTKKAP